MYYEVYIDSLFLIQFTMNLYLLLLMNYSTLCTATRGRVILGALCGAGIGLLQVLIGGPVWMYGVGMACSAMLMIYITFRVKDMRTFCSLLKKMLLYSFLMGGSLLFIIQRLQSLRRYITGVFGILGTGAILCVFFLDILEKEKRRGRDNKCYATLYCGEERTAVVALIDSGNSLYEPISREPVCVIDEKVFHTIFKPEPQLYRAVPYHSIGKNHGILKGYILPKMELEIGGMIKTFQNVYVAICHEEISDGVGMLIHPMIFRNQRKRRGKV